MAIWEISGAVTFPFFPIQKDRFDSHSHSRVNGLFIRIPMGLPWDPWEFPCGVHVQLAGYGTQFSPTLDSCCPNSSNFCCSGVLSDSVSVISVLILPAAAAATATAVVAARSQSLS